MANLLFLKNCFGSYILRLNLWKYGVPYHYIHYMFMQKIQKFETFEIINFDTNWNNHCKHLQLNDLAHACKLKRIRNKCNMTFFHFFFLNLLHFCTMIMIKLFPDCISLYKTHSKFCTINVIKVWLMIFNN